MKKITTAEELKSVILQLEQRQSEDWSLLKGQIGERINPVNVLKHSLHEFTTSPTLKQELVVSALELAGKLIAQKLEGHSHGTFVNILGRGVASAVKSPDVLNSIAELILSSFTKENLNTTLKEYKKEEVL